MALAARFCLFIKLVLIHIKLQGDIFPVVFVTIYLSSQHPCYVGKYYDL